MPKPVIWIGAAFVDELFDAKEEIMITTCLNPYSSHHRLRFMYT